MFFYFRYEKERLERKRIADASKGMGKPKVGGPFELVDQNGKHWDSTKEMRGKFSLVRSSFAVVARASHLEFEVHGSKRYQEHRYASMARLN